MQNWTSVRDLDAAELINGRKERWMRVTRPLYGT